MSRITLLGALLTTFLVIANSGYSFAQVGQMPLPEDHVAPGFLFTHGKGVEVDVTPCAACHSRDSCGECHVKVGEVWPPPPSHTPFFLYDHQARAAGETSQCASCHVIEQDCQVCHLGSETLERPRDDLANYHPLGFLEQHSTAAFNRENECASCHNPEVSCRHCHIGLGRARGDRTDTGYHNADASFLFGHGQAARQGLESCAACHAQQDCLACHSAKGGLTINPHGPDFVAEKLRSKNRGLCLFCHSPSVIEP